MVKFAHGPKITMCSSKLCFVCLSLFLLSFLPEQRSCKETEQNKLYDKVIPKPIKPNEETLKQIIPQNSSNTSEHERLVKRQYFISKLFEDFGNEKGVLTHDGLDKMLTQLGFKVDHVDKDHDHSEDHHHNHFENEHKHSEEEDQTPRNKDKRYLKIISKNESSVKEEYNVDSMLHEYGYTAGITRNQFVNFCPGFLFMLMGLEHADEHDHNGIHQHLNTSESSYRLPKVWGFSCLSVTVISLVGLLGVTVIPIMQKVFYNHLLQFLVALAVGALSGDAMLHLIPHAFESGHSSHGEHDHHDNSQHMSSVLKGLCGLLGIYFFFLIERLLTIHTQEKQKRKKGKSKNTNNKTVCSKEQHTSFIGQTRKINQPDCEDMIMGIHPGHKALKNYAEESHNADCHKLDDMSDEDNHVNCKKPTEEEEPTLVLSHSHGGHGHSHCHKVPKTVAAIAWMVIIGDGIHNFSDGLAIGAAFADSLTGGLSTTIAIFCHELPHEIGDFAVLLRAGMTVKQALVYNCVSSVLAFMGMSIGIFIGNIDGASLWIFVGVAGMFLYIALVDMLPQVSDVDTKKGEHPLCHLLLQMSGMLLGGGIMFLVAIFEQDMKNIF
ncbi:zinc transporter ZIP6-like isoform X1 [Mytilus californianus]|uniref:zinc transporter ZIP6-like isoform X1 n=1 Tax=Mytilus californianus TaxID=6549 RepID=UPI002247C14A|nr:zinc transporter ZIP6-like isoform X1 [Mytilus californianus]